MNKEILAELRRRSKYGDKEAKADLKSYREEKAFEKFFSTLKIFDYEFTMRGHRIPTNKRIEVTKQAIKYILHDNSELKKVLTNNPVIDRLSFTSNPTPELFEAEQVYHRKYKSEVAAYPVIQIDGHQYFSKILITGGYVYPN